MQKATINNLFNMESFSFKGETNHVSLHAAFYQQIPQKLIKAVYNTEALKSVGNRLIALADHALNLKQDDQVRQIGDLLAHPALPREYQGIGQYYQAACRKLYGEADQSRLDFQRLAESPSLPLSFRARAIQAIGVSYLDRDQFEEAIRFYSQAAQVALTKPGSNLLVVVNAQLVIAIYRSVSGDHEGALRQLENMRPLVRMLAPHQMLPRYMYINSLAVELGELGRLEEARRMAEIAVRSPYAAVYPEWQETYDDIIAKMRRGAALVAGLAWPPNATSDATLSVTGYVSTNNVVTLPVAARPTVAFDALAAPPQPGRVIAYHGWQQPLPEPAEPSHEMFTPEDLKQMSIADKQAALLAVIYSDDVTHDTLDPLLVAAGKAMNDSPAS